jgi:hypothetical protein
MYIEAACAGPTVVLSLHPTGRIMTATRNSVAMLDRAEKRQQEIKSLIDSTYGDKKMSYSDINCLIKAVKYLK